MLAASRLFRVAAIATTVFLAATPAAFAGGRSEGKTAAASEGPGGHTAGPAAAVERTQFELVESRWLPWLGCWELRADAVDYREVESVGERVVCMAPRPDGLGVALTTYLDGVAIGEDTVVANGERHESSKPGCTGWQRSSWSADGYRLHSESETSCEGGSGQSLVGLSMLADHRWVELQSLSVEGSADRELIVRRYQRLGAPETADLGFAPLDPSLMVRAATARAAASGPLDVDAVVEAFESLPLEIVEATILESGSTFDLDRDALLRLADARVEDRIIDLMVAVSFPDQFIVDRGSGGGGGGGSYGGFYGGLYYSPWLGPSCASYGYYSYSPWYTPFGYGYYGPGCGYGAYRPPIYGYRPGGGGGGGAIVRVPPSGSLHGGRVIKGRGYATVRARPTPQDGDRSTGRVFRNAANALGSSSRSRGSVGPGGFSGGSSSGSSSGSGKATRTAKPRGGGKKGGG